MREQKKPGAVRRLVAVSWSDFSYCRALAAGERVGGPSGAGRGQLDDGMGTALKTDMGDPTVH